MAAEPQVKVATTADEVRACIGPYRALRPHITEADDLVARWEAAWPEGVELAYVAGADGAAAAICLYRTLTTTAWGKVLYIDDLATAPDARGQGFAGAMLAHAESVARKRGCDAVHLDSGPARHDAHRLYLNAGFQINSHHFAKRLSAGS